MTATDLIRLYEKMVSDIDWRLEKIEHLLEIRTSRILIDNLIREKEDAINRKGIYTSFIENLKGIKQ